MQKVKLQVLSYSTVYNIKTIIQKNISKNLDENFAIKIIETLYLSCELSALIQPVFLWTGSATSETY